MIAYLDNSATTKPSSAAIDKMNAALVHGYFNPSSMYAPAMNVEKELNAARQDVLAAINAPRNWNVFFTSGGTESNNLALMGAISRKYGSRHILTSPAEHPSVLESCEELERMGHKLTLVRHMKDGSLDYDSLEMALKDQPDLVSLMQVNNETGALLDVPKASGMIRSLAPSALIHVDGVQGFMRVPIEPKLIDMYTLSAHKIHGPKGVGALICRPEVKLAPRQIGGGQQGGIRSGTENTPGIMGLQGAICYMNSLGNVAEALMEKKLRFYNALAGGIDGLVVNGHEPELGAPHIINLSFPGVRGEVMLHSLEAHSIYCSTGSACSSKKRKLSGVLQSMHVPAQLAESAVRFSFCPDTTDAEIDYAALKITECYDILKKFRRR